MVGTIIFANGQLNPPYPKSTDFLPEDWIIAADGGAVHCTRLGIKPQLLIGDFDSLTSSDLDSLLGKGSQVIRHSSDKDETDLELAILYAINHEARQVIVYGALGARWDMTLANLMMLTHPALMNTQLRLIDGYQEISLLRSGQALQIHGNIGDTISLIPLSPNAIGINTHGLKYSLLNGILSLGSPRGVSNVIVDEQCEITLTDGVLVVIHLRHRFS